jgi:hypothetical protein
MKFKVIDANAASDWGAALRRFPAADIYFLAEYHRAHEQNGAGTALAFIAEDGKEFFFILSSKDRSKKKQRQTYPVTGTTSKPLKVMVGLYQQPRIAVSLTLCGRDSPTGVMTTAW